MFTKTNVAWRVATCAFIAVANLMAGVKFAASECFTTSDFVDFAKKDAEENDRQIKVLLWESEASTFVIYAFNKAYSGKVMIAFFDHNQCIRTYAGRFQHIVNLNETMAKNVSESHLVYERKRDKEV